MTPPYDALTGTNLSKELVGAIPDHTALALSCVRAASFSRHFTVQRKSATRALFFKVRDGGQCQIRTDAHAFEGRRQVINNNSLRAMPLTQSIDTDCEHRASRRKFFTRRRTNNYCAVKLRVALTGSPVPLLTITV